MKTRVSPTLVGLFVLGALAIATIAIMSFGGVNFFSKPQRFIVYFDESVHGLDLGSPVKLRGVRVGRVVDMNVVYESATSDSLVGVVCEFSRNVIVSPKGDLIDVSDRKRIESMIHNGMRAQLGVHGLATGMLFVELDFAPPDDNASEVVAPPGEDNGKYIVMPSSRSAIATMQANIISLISKLNASLPGIVADLQSLLKDARAQVSSLDLGAMIREITDAGKSVSDLASSAEVRQMFLDLNSAITELRRTLAKLDRGLDPTSEKFNIMLVDAQTAMRKFTETAEAARHFINSQSGVGEDLAQALRRISEAAASVERLADFLERNPNALISGKRPPPQ